MPGIADDFQSSPWRHYRDATCQSDELFVSCASHHHEGL